MESRFTKRSLDLSSSTRAVRRCRLDADLATTFIALTRFRQAVRDFSRVRCRLIAGHQSVGRPFLPFNPCEQLVGSQTLMPLEVQRKSSATIDRVRR
jgi:hypothetical protein